MNERRLNVYDMRDNSSDVAGDSVWGSEVWDSGGAQESCVIKTIKLYKPEICV